MVNTGLMCLHNSRLRCKETYQTQSKYVTNCEHTLLSVPFSPQMDVTMTMLAADVILQCCVHLPGVVRVSVCFIHHHLNPC